MGNRDEEYDYLFKGRRVAKKTPLFSRIPSKQPIFVKEVYKFVKPKVERSPKERFGSSFGIKLSVPSSMNHPQDVTVVVLDYNSLHVISVPYLCFLGV